MKKTKFGILSAILLIVFNACQHDDVATISDDELVLKSAEVTASDVTLQSILEDVNYDAELFAQSEMWLRQLAHFNHGKTNLLKDKANPRYADGSFPNVSIDTAAAGYPIKITIDYGTGTTLHHGRKLSGVVTIEISAAHNTNGATRTITYTNCKVDSIQVGGSSKEVFTGDNATTRKITNTADVNFVLANGTKLARKGDEVREWLAGIATQQDHSDDKIQVTGSQSISSSTGDSWTKTIKTPLIRTGECRYYVSGIVEYLVKGSVAATLNYGDGTCDEVATVTASGKTVEIELKSKAMPKTEGFKHK